jgi:hypothetical protein
MTAFLPFIASLSVKVSTISPLPRTAAAVKSGAGRPTNTLMSLSIYIWIVIIEVITLRNHFDKKFPSKKIGTNMEITILNNEFFY